MVTLADVRRITPHADGAEFTEYRVPSHPVYYQETEDPFWHKHVFKPDKTRRVLKQRPGGDCFFLGSEGCVLPKDARPLVCRLYPFDYNADGILPVTYPGCPLELLQPGQDLITELGMRLEDAQPIHAQLYREICETEPLEA